MRSRALGLEDADDVDRFRRKKRHVRRRGVGVGVSAGVSVSVSVSESASVSVGMAVVTDKRFMRFCSRRMVHPARSSTRLHLRPRPSIRPRQPIAVSRLLARRLASLMRLCQCLRSFTLASAC
eukprot:1997056-Pleurochrysis_carterae.AAC.2